LESLVLAKAVMLGVQVGWIDFSPEERSRTLTVLRALSAPGSVDELGIGIVRDAVADALFPGTSTLLTKARYFFLVPYLSRLLEEGHDATPRDSRDLKHEFDGLERILRIDDLDGEARVHEHVVAEPCLRRQIERNLARCTEDVHSRKAILADFSDLSRYRKAHTANPSIWTWLRRFSSARS
jgi:hypothetical protein